MEKELMNVRAQAAAALEELANENRAHFNPVRLLAIGCSSSEIAGGVIGHNSTYELGELKYVNMTMNKSWERYGIHALEPVYRLTGPGYVSVQNTGGKENNILHLTHSRGIDVNIASIYYLAGSPIKIVGDKDSVTVTTKDSYSAFHKQLDVFVEYLETGVPPYPFDETVELMTIIIAGIRSREEGGRRVMLSEIRAELDG